MSKVPTPNRVQRFVSSIANSRFFVLSLLIHVVLIGIFGSLVIFKAIQEQEAFIAPAKGDGTFLQETDEAEGEEEEEELEFAASSAMEVAEVSPPAQSMLSSLNQAAPWTASATPDTMTAGSMGTSYMPASLGMDSGGGGGVRGSGGTKMGTLFGKQIRSAKLGVVFDVSFSTHKTIDSALQEIEKNFPDAIVVLAPGCGIQKGKNGKRVGGKVVEGGDYLKNLEKYRIANAKFYMGRFLPALLEQNKNFAEMWSDGVREKRMHVLHLDPSQKSGDALVNGTQFAFRFLSDQGVDTIWWFADFEDEIEEEEATVTGRELARRNIRVIEHDFDGGKQLETPAKRVLAAVTNGSVIIGEKQ